MHRTVSRALGAFPLLALSFVALSSGALAGCTASPIGDPCEPESIPPGGFDHTEVYLETSSVQCRTRVCMVYHLQGDPASADATAKDNQIFCSCRCSIGNGAEANTPLCGCPGGYTCIDNLVTTGGSGVIGGYCVPCIYDGDQRNLDPSVFEQCPTG
jgi:hypothetical protein